jgi:hypothetical protein
MGGGINKKNRNKIKNKAERDKTPFLSSNDIWNERSMTIQGGGSTQVNYASDISPESYLGETIQDETVQDVLTLFIAICYLLIEKFKEVKNKKLIHFISKLDGMKRITKNDLSNSPEFKTFQKYCGNKSIKQYNGYDIVRKFLTKYFSDSSGIFMGLKKSEWAQYVNRFLKN